MAAPATKQEIESAVIHLLAESGASLTPKEMSEALNVKAPLITRAVFQIKKAVPQMVDIDPESGGSRYHFIGDRDFLDPLPEGVEINIKGLEKAPKSAPAPAKAASPKTAKTKTENIGTLEGFILSFFKGKKKEPASAIHEEMQPVASVKDVDNALKALESKGAMERQSIDEFDEDVFALTDKGRTMIPATAPVADSKVKSTAKPASKPAAKAASKGASKATAKSKGAGRPSGERDFEVLHKRIAEYVGANPGLTKTEVSKDLAKTMDKFGRMSIAEEVLKLAGQGVLVPFVDDEGRQVANRFQLPKKKAAPAKTVAKKQPAQKAPAAAAQAPETGVAGQAVSGGYASTSVSGISQGEIESLKAELQSFAQAGNESLSSSVGALFGRVEAYIDQLEQSNKRLREINTQIMNMV